MILQLSGPRTGQWTGYLFLFCFIYKRLYVFNSLSVISGRRLISFFAAYRFDEVEKKISPFLKSCGYNLKKGHAIDRYSILLTFILSYQENGFGTFISVFQLIHISQGLCLYMLSDLCR